jgi:predicted nucleotidyltransferase
MADQIPRQLLAELNRELWLIYGNQLVRVYLFGSYARGEQDPESDLDILIVLRDYASYSSEVKRTGRLISRLSLEHGVSISRKFIRQLDWNTGNSLLVRNIRDEAMPT